MVVITSQTVVAWYIKVQTLNKVMGMPLFHECLAELISKCLVEECILIFKTSWHSNFLLAIIDKLPAEQ